VAPTFEEEEEEDEEDLFLQQALALSMLPQQTASKAEKEEDKEDKEEEETPVAPSNAAEVPPSLHDAPRAGSSPTLSTLSVDAVAFAPMSATAEEKADEKNDEKVDAEETKVETKHIETKEEDVEEEAFSVVPFASFQEKLLSKGISLERMMLWNRKDDEILMEWCR